MHSLRWPYRFGEAVVKRRRDVRVDEQRMLLTASSTMHEILAARDSSAIVDLFDEMRGTRRFAPPTRALITRATQSIERALREGEIVGVRRARCGGANASGAAVTAPTPLDSKAASTEATPPFPFPEESLTWFEVTCVDEAGEPLRSLDLQFTRSGRTQRLRTDARGMARVDDVEGSIASVRPANCAGLRETLLAGARADGALPPILADAIACEVRDDMDAIPLYSELPCVVVFRARAVQWLGLELLDQHGLPVAFATFRVAPQRGDVFVGRLDARGRARIDIAAGPYTVVFPDFDASAITPGASRDEPS